MAEEPGTEEGHQNIDRFREQIDEIDRKLVELLDARAGVAREIGKAKLSVGRQKFFDASRQKQVIQKAMTAANGTFPNEALRNVFVEIMSGCLAREKPPTVGYLGPEATFSHLAALDEFGNSVAFQPYNSITDVFLAVDRDWIDYGVVPIENSTGGIIHTTLDMFLEYDLRICSEIYLHIHHNLISNNPIDRIKTIYSKTEPFQQCQIWLKENLAGVQLIEVGSTVKGVELARNRDYAAAIGSEIASRKLNVPIIAAQIEDMKDNTTRFLVIGKQQSEPTGKDKTSVMVSIKDRPGALFDLLKSFASRDINLTKIESRPTRRKAWDLVFFIDMEGHQKDAAVAQALETLREHTESMRVMGSYPRDVKTSRDIE
jgi:chorismate mutase / prephenate dehydratase